MRFLTYVRQKAFNVNNNLDLILAHGKLKGNLVFSKLKVHCAKHAGLFIYLSLL